MIPTLQPQRPPFLAAAALFSLLLSACDGERAVPRAAVLAPDEPGRSPATAPAPPDPWLARVSRLAWVTYSPPSADPTKQLPATPEAMAADLVTLRGAGFSGLVTYGASGAERRELPHLADRAGFKGMIVGVWDPKNRAELAASAADAKHHLVLGVCAGNEGLDKRYSRAELAASIASLRHLTGKPVTTTEEIDDYRDETLLELGDWVFPNAHPYFHHRFAAEAAVRWTQEAFDRLQARARRPVWFKEVGFPTAGDPEHGMNEALQEAYYVALARTGVRFCYFEGYNQPWKTHLPIEPYWGLFKADRAPKRLARRLIRQAAGGRDPGGMAGRRPQPAGER